MENKRQIWRPSNMLYPVPPVLVTCRDEEGRDNCLTIAWAGTVCSDPVMVSISVRPSRYSHAIIKRTGEFVLCLTTEKMARAVDYCGVVSGRDVDKFEKCGLTRFPGKNVNACGIAESPVCLECRVEQAIPLGSHDLFLARVLSTDVDERCLDENGKLDLGRAGLIAWSHGSYMALGRELGTFGYSVRKKTRSVPRKGTAGTERTKPDKTARTKRQEPGAKRRKKENKT